VGGDVRRVALHSLHHRSPKRSRPLSQRSDGTHAKCLVGTRMPWFASRACPGYGLLARNVVCEVANSLREHGLEPVLPLRR
jgi:hypothetical protein